MSGAGTTFGARSEPVLALRLAVCEHESIPFRLRAGSASAADATWQTNMHRKVYSYVHIAATRTLHGACCTIMHTKPPLYVPDALTRTRK
jgi:hypothetical protein